MRVRFGIVVAAAGLVLAGCNGPKSTCEGSYKSYCNTLEGADWEGMYELLTPEFKKKARSAAAMNRVMSDVWKGAKSWSFKTQNVNETKEGFCTVQGEMKWTVKIRGALPYDESTYFSWVFKQQKDGLWYIELPGHEKITGY